MKELPKMYHNNISKNIENNKKIFSTLEEEKNIPLEKNTIKVDNKNNYTIEQKIYNIFNSPNYIYKIDVTIVTDTNTTKERIVGKTKTNLITIDGRYIPINTIRDIYITG